jgi:hypothetical protein
MGLVGTKRYGSKQFLTCEWVLLHFVRILYSCVSRNFRFKLGLKVRVVEDAEGTCIDVINNGLLET